MPPKNHTIQVKFTCEELDEIKELLEHAQGLNDEINSKSQEIRGVSDSSFNIKAEDFIKNGVKSEHAHPEKDEIKTKSQEINPVLEAKND